MTKKQCKNKIARLEGRIDRMQEQVIHYRRQVKVLDAEDSKRLLEKFHIESEELAELLMNRGKNIRAEEPVQEHEPESQAEPDAAPRAEHTEQPETPEHGFQPMPEGSSTSMMDAFRKEAEQ